MSDYIYECPQCGEKGDSDHFHESWAGELFCPKCECYFQVGDDEDEEG